MKEPTNEKIKGIIDRTAFEVSKRGKEFERILMEHYSFNDTFSFMFNLNCYEYQYY